MTPRNALNQYLLNQLTEPEREQVLERILSEEGFAEVVEEAERDLLDAYVREELPRAVRSDVEKELLYNGEQRAKLLVAQALAHKRRARMVRGFLPIAAAALLVMAAVGSYYTLMRQSPPAKVARVRGATPPASTLNREPVAAILLSPGSTRGARMVAVHLGRAPALRLDLELPADAGTEKVAAHLVNQAHLTVWSAAALQPSVDGLSIEVPAAVLTTGQFQLIVDARSPVTYFFAVR